MWGDDDPGFELGEEPEEAPEPVDPQDLMRAGLVFYGVMGCGALLWRMWTPGESIFHPSIAAAETAWSPLAAIGVGALAGLAAIAISEALTQWSDLGEALADLLGEGVAGLSVADGILLALASGFAEEMFFRGALQPAVGLFWASLAFGACHFMPRRELALWSAFAVVMGVGFGALFEWTGQLAAPIAAHVVVNAVNLPRLGKRFEEKEAAERAAQTAATTRLSDLGFGARDGGSAAADEAAEKTSDNRDQDGF
ncbi:MAG: lysostaphin resistance A-like protein [Myxococcota bacterium]